MKLCKLRNYNIKNFKMGSAHLDFTNSTDSIGSLLELGFTKQSIAKTVVEIHGVELKVVNQLINGNIDEFEENIDIIDLKKLGQ